MPEFAGRFHQTLTAAPGAWRRGDRDTAAVIRRQLGYPRGEFKDFVGEFGDRPTLRPEHRDTPERLTFDVVFVAKRCHETRAYKRRLPATGSANDGDKPAGYELQPQSVGLRLAPEEIVLIPAVERTETGIRLLARKNAHDNQPPCAYPRQLIADDFFEGFQPTAHEFILRGQNAFRLRGS